MYKTITAEALIRRAATLLGMDYATLPDNIREALASHLHYRVAEMLGAAQWPDMTDVEELTPDEDTGYIAASAGTNGTIGQVFEVFDGDPRSADNPARLAFRTEGAGFYLTDLPPDSDTVFARVAYADPEITGEAWEAGTAYAAGEAVLHGGNCYVAKSATTGNEPPNATYWTPQAIPAFVADFATRGAAADALREENQYEKAGAQEAAAYRVLDGALQKAVINQSQAERFEVNYR